MKTTAKTYCKHFENSCYHPQYIANSITRAVIISALQIPCNVLMMIRGVIGKVSNISLILFWLGAISKGV